MLFCQEEFFSLCLFIPPKALKCQRGQKKTKAFQYNFLARETSRAFNQKTKIEVEKNQKQKNASQNTKLNREKNRQPKR